MTPLPLQRLRACLLLTALASTGLLAALNLAVRAAGRLGVGR